MRECQLEPSGTRTVFEVTGREPNPSDGPHMTSLSTIHSGGGRSLRRCIFARSCENKRLNHGTLWSQTTFDRPRNLLVHNSGQPALRPFACDLLCASAQHAKREYLIHDLKSSVANHDFIRVSNTTGIDFPFDLQGIVQGDDAVALDQR